MLDRSLKFQKNRNEQMAFGVTAVAIFRGKFMTESARGDVRVGRAAKYIFKI